MRVHSYLKYIFLSLVFLGVGSTHVFAAGDAMGYLIWGKGDPVYFAPGKTGTFSDGNLISLVHETSGFDFKNDVFTVEMKIKNKETAHTFKIDSFMGKSAWLVVDPSGTDITPTFTGKFLAELCKLGRGKHAITVTFKVNGKVKNKGNLVYTSDGKHAKFKVILAKFKNPELARKMANEEFQKEQDAKEQKEDRDRREKDAKNYYRITVQNNNAGYTYYVIAVDDRTGSEKIHEVRPRSSVVLELYRNQNYTIKAYHQNQSKSAAGILARVSASWNNKTLTVK